MPFVWHSCIYMVAFHITRTVSWSNGNEVQDKATRSRCSEASRVPESVQHAERGFNSLTWGLTVSQSNRWCTAFIPNPARVNQCCQVFQHIDTTDVAKFNISLSELVPIVSRPIGNIIQRGYQNLLVSFNKIIPSSVLHFSNPFLVAARP